MLEKLIYEWYGLIVEKTEKAVVGAGSDTYFIECGSEKYVLKFPCSSIMNNPEAEPELCDFLLKHGIAVSEFVKNKFGDYICKNINNRIFHLQKFVDGCCYELNKAPEWLMRESACTLGKLHTTLSSYK